MCVPPWVATRDQIHVLEEVHHVLAGDPRGGGSGVDRAVFCGHSLGAAVAVLLGLIYTFRTQTRASNEVDMSVVTFGCPSIGDAALQEYVLQVIVHKRFFVEYALVAGLPRWTSTGLRFCPSAQDYAETPAREHWALSPRGHACMASGATPAVKSLSAAGTVFGLHHSLDAYATRLLHHFWSLHAAPLLPSQDLEPRTSSSSKASIDKALRPSPFRSRKARSLSRPTCSPDAHTSRPPACKFRSLLPPRSFAVCPEDSSQGYGLATATASPRSMSTSHSSASARGARARRRGRWALAGASSGAANPGPSAWPARTAVTTALHRVASMGLDEEFIELLAAGYPVDAMDSKGHTPLHKAASAGHVKLVKALIAVGAAVDGKISPEGTPLHEAASSGHVEVLRALLDSGAVVDLFNSELTPLHKAVFAGSVGAVTALLAGGAAVNTLKVPHWTALHAAASVGHV